MKHFYVSGLVNKQNFRYRSQANPRALHEKPLHSEKVTVWCAMSESGIIGPYFFFRMRLAMLLLLMRTAIWKCRKISSPHNSLVFVSMKIRYSSRMEQ